VKILTRGRSLPFFRQWAFALVALAWAGCGREQVQEYQVARESPPVQQPALPPGHSDMTAAAAPALDCKPPSDWQEASRGQMRVASFRVSGGEGQQAEVSVIPLPEPAGTVLDNVNRWRGQVGLAGVAEAELAGLAQPVEIAGQAAKLYEAVGVHPDTGKRASILAAMMPRDGVVWFFKMSGDADLVAGQKRPFVEFLKTVSFPERAPAGQPDAAPAP